MLTERDEGLKHDNKDNIKYRWTQCADKQNEVEFGDARQFQRMLSVITFCGGLSLVAVDQDIPQPAYFE